MCGIFRTPHLGSLAWAHGAAYRHTTTCFWWLMHGCGVCVLAPPGSMQQADDQFLNRVFLFVAFIFIFWLMIAWMPQSATCTQFMDTTSMCHQWTVQNNIHYAYEFVIPVWNYTANFSLLVHMHFAPCVVYFVTLQFIRWVLLLQLGLIHLLQWLLAIFLSLWVIYFRYTTVL